MQRGPVAGIDAEHFLPQDGRPTRQELCDLDRQQFRRHRQRGGQRGLAGYRRINLATAFGDETMYDPVARKVVGKAAVAGCIAWCIQRPKPRLMAVFSSNARA